MPLRFPGLRRAAALVLFAATAMVLGAKGVDALEEPWIADKARRVAALTRDLAPRVPPGATVQVMDVTEGGVHALWSLRLRQPTRFIYDFHFFHDTGDPRIVALRRGIRGGPRGAAPLPPSWCCATPGTASATSGSRTGPTSRGCSRARIPSPSRATATGSMSSALIPSIIRAYDDPVVRAYCWGRFWILRQRFLDEIGQYLPAQGRVLDLGCGFGLFSLYYAATRPGICRSRGSI